jgi:transposase
MVTLDEYARIRRAHAVEGLGVKALARQFGHSRQKIREILANPEPKRYVRIRRAPLILDPFKPIIDAIVEADEQAPRKQQHTVSRLWRRLQQEHGFSGGYERVRLYLLGKQRQKRETFIPLDHDPGQRLEADFGHIYVDFPEGRKQVPVLIMTWGYSNCPFALALPTERTEAILHGMTEAFHFFGCVPREVWWDNPKTVAPFLCKGRQRVLHERYRALASHYNFEPLFCLVRRPQEKPRVEGRVQFLQQDWCTPVPKVQDLAELNAHLHQCCLRDRERTQAGQTETIGQRFERDSDKALSLPRHRFDACLQRPGRVDKYQTVRFDSNAYSVPRMFAFQTVTIKAYVEHVEVVSAGQVIARHQRSYGSGLQILDPLHYLATLGRRPAALDHANVYRRWELPAVFGQLRADLERQHGSAAGARQFIRVLQLLAEHPLERVQRAIEQSQRAEGFQVDRIVERTSRRAGTDRATVADLSALPASVRSLQVPLPNLHQFDVLLSREEVNDESNECVVGEIQLEAPPSAGHACRVREAGPGGGDCQRGLRAVPAAADRAGGLGSCGQRAPGPDQASGLSSAQGFGYVRLLGDACAQ